MLLNAVILYFLINLFNPKGTVCPILGPKEEMISLPWKRNITLDAASSHVEEKSHREGLKVYFHIF